MKNKKIAMLLPVFLLTGCGTNSGIHVSTPKEILVKDKSFGDLVTTKNVYTYDKKGNILSDEEYTLDVETNLFKLDFKLTYTYYDNGDFKQFIREKDVDGTRKVVEKCVYSYDANKVTKQETYVLNSSGELYVKYYTGDFTYDSLNRNTGCKDYVYNEETSQYDLSSTVKYTYSEKFLTPVKIESTDVVFGDFLIERELDDYGKIMHEKGTNPVYSQITFFTYTEFDEVSSEASYMIDSETGAYKISSMYDYTYVKHHYLSEETRTYFDEEGNVRLFKTFETEYDEKMNILSNIESELDFETDEFEVIVDKEYSY